MMQKFGLRLVGGNKAAKKSRERWLVMMTGWLVMMMVDKIIGGRICRVEKEVYS